MLRLFTTLVPEIFVGNEYPFKYPQGAQPLGIGVLENFVRPPLYVAFSYKPVELLVVVQGERFGNAVKTRRVEVYSAWT